MNDRYIKNITDYLVKNTSIDTYPQLEIYYPNEEPYRYFPEQINLLGKSILFDLKEIFACTSEEAELILGIYILYLTEEVGEVKEFLLNEEK